MSMIEAGYAYLDTRITIFSQRLLSRSNLERLIEGPSDDLERLLDKAGLPGAREKLATLAPLQSTFLNRLLEEATIIIRPLEDAPRNLIRSWIRRFSQINLKTIIRGKQARWSPEAIRNELVAIGPFESLPVDDLVRAEDLSELLRRLETTEYAPVIHHARDRFQETQDPFWIEALLDRRYFEGLHTRMGDLSRADRESVEPLVGQLLDEVNLVWLLRYRFAYGLSPAHAHFLLPGNGIHLHGETLSRIVKLEALETVLERLPHSLQALVEGAGNTPDVEDRLEAARLDAARKTLRYSRFNLGRALAYLMLREGQFAGIHAAVRGRSLDLPAELIREIARLEVRTGIS